MKLPIKIALFLMALLSVMAACTNKNASQRATQTNTDKRYSYEYVKKISVTQPKKALQVLQHAEEHKLMSPIDINILRSKVYYNSMLDYKKATFYAEAALNDSDINNRPEQLMSLLYLAALEYYNCGNYAKCLNMADRAITTGYKYDNRQLVGKVLTTMGQCHSEIGNVGHAINCFDRSIIIFKDEVKKSPNWNLYYALTTSNALKANTYLEMKQYKELFQMKTEYEGTLKKLNTLPEGISGVNDLANATFYSIYAIGYEETGNHAEGSALYDKLIVTRAANTPEGATFVVPYLMLTKHYNEALSKVNEMESVWTRSGKDSIDYNYIHNILANKAKTLQAMGRYKESLETGIRAYDLNDSLNRRIKAQNALRVSEQLGKKMLKKHIERQETLLRINHIANIVIGALLVICIGLMIIGFRINKKLKAKNQAASTLVKELLLYKKQLMDHLAADEANNAKNNRKTLEANDDKQQQYDEFLRMEKMVIDRGLFLQPKLERSDVAKEMGISTSHFNELFARFSDQSFTNFINDLRMEHAAKLLKDKSNYTIEAIANECGVPIRQTFYRLFSKKFGMTPAEYRNVVADE